MLKRSTKSQTKILKIMEQNYIEKLNVMRKMTFLCAMLLAFFIARAQTEPPMATMKVPYRQLIISEWHGSDNPWSSGIWEKNVNAYVELTNVGDSTVNMKDFSFFSTNQPSVPTIPYFDDEGKLIRVDWNPVHPVTGAFHASGRTEPDDTFDWYILAFPDYLLKPGESYVMMPVFDRTYEDGTLMQQERLVEKAQYFQHPNEYALDPTIALSYYPEFQNFNFDSISGHGNSDRDFDNTLATSGRSRFFLKANVYDDAGNVLDSVVVDSYGARVTASGNGIPNVPPVAGVFEAALSYNLVRKSSVTQGTLDWDKSSGTNTEDSEWLLMPRILTRHIGTTAGVHGTFAPSAQSDIMGINLAAGTITVPWGNYRLNNGDSLFNHITLGPGMAWRYLEDPTNFENGKYTTVMDGDTLKLFTAAGEVVDIKNLRIILQAPAANETRVFPTRTFIPADPLAKTVAPYLPQDDDAWGDIKYYVTALNNVMDSIGNIPFATRVDSLFKHVVKAEKASWEIVWVDGQPRVDLKNGDILRVTAENGTDKKDYYLNLLPYVPGSNPSLASITWPDKPGFMMRWNGDTIPNFYSGLTVYNVRLPFNHSGVPALQVTTQDPNATVQMFPASSIETGPAEDRTTLITVTSEDNTETRTYKVVFVKEKLVQQDWQAEPIIAQLGNRTLGWSMGIYNPGTVPIDLSEYLIKVGTEGIPNASTMLGPETAAGDKNWNFRYKWYIPGMKWPAKFEDYQINPGKMIFDPVVDPILEPGETFVINEIAGAWMGGHPDMWIHKKVNVTLLSQFIDFQDWEEAGGNQWGEWDRAAWRMMWAHNGSRSAIWKIQNDSIREGTKAIMTNDDFQLIEQYRPGPAATNRPAGKQINQANQILLMRKPHYITTATAEAAGFGTNEEDSDWINLQSGEVYEGVLQTADIMARNLGNHFADEATFFLSIVYSNVYKVDEGYEGDLSISGVSNGENVETFLNNLIKADPGQTLVLSGTAEGPAKEPTDAVAAGDFLTVTSKEWIVGEDTLVNRTVYTISLTPLDANNTLTKVAGSNLELERDNFTASISGFPFGTTIREVFEQVVKPALATMDIVDASGQLIPLTVLNTGMVKVPTIADNRVYFRVKAENGNVMMYRLRPTSAASEAYVLSNVYVVSQDPPKIDAVPHGTSVAGFFANLMPAPGATLQVKNKTGADRNLGEMNYDDLLFVTSQDKSVTKAYLIQFTGEPEGLQAEIRTVAPAPTNLRADVPDEATSVNLAWDYESGLEFGFVISRDGVAIGSAFTNAFTDPNVVPKKMYQYSVHAYNEFGPSVSATIDVFTGDNTAVVQIPNDEISIYPSPTTDMVYFRNIPEGSRVVLTDMLGRNLLVKEASELSSGLSLQPYDKGFYLISIFQGQKYVKSVKVLKK